jgi:hypothetical protein
LNIIDKIIRDLRDSVGINCARVDISSATRIASARGSATRRRSFATREPVQRQLSVRIFACNRAEASVVGQGHGHFTNGAMLE